MSYVSTQIRYEELYAIDPNQARATSKEYHDEIVEHLVDHLRELEEDSIFDDIQIYQRDRRCVFDSEVDQGSSASKLEDCLFGKWTKGEAGMLEWEQNKLSRFHDSD